MQPLGSKHRVVLWFAALSVAAAAFFGVGVDYMHGYYDFGLSRKTDADMPSDSIIQNSILNRVRGSAANGFPMYRREARDNAAAGAGALSAYHYSNLALHGRTLFAVARVMGVRDDAAVERFGAGVRSVFGVLLALAAVGAMLLVTRPRTIPQYATVAVFVGLCGGFVMFARNLYWITWTFFLPLLAVAWTDRGHIGRRVLIPYGAAVAVMVACHYEFWTVFVIMAALPFATSARPTRVFLKHAAVLGLVAVAVVTAIVVLHAIVIGRDRGEPVASGFSYLAGRVRVRNLSLARVPSPISHNALTRFVYRQRIGPAILLPGAPRNISDMYVWFTAIGLLIWFWRRGDVVGVRTLCLGVAAYASWYVLAYQHIIWHIIYDSLLFASTVQFATCAALVHALRPEPASLPVATAAAAIG